MTSANQLENIPRAGALGRRTNTTPAPGGAASATAEVVTFGDGHSVRIGEIPGPFGAPSQTGAFGGEGSFSITRRLETISRPAVGNILIVLRDEMISGAPGGDATSSSEGITHANSEVRVFDQATGGTGGSVFGSGKGSGGRGGGAASHAKGANAGNV